MESVGGGKARVRCTPWAGGNINTMHKAYSAALSPMNRKTKVIEDMMFPNLPNEPVRAMAAEMLKKIRGTIAVNIRLMKISPSGFK
jgi:hypothetical protein